MIVSPKSCANSSACRSSATEREIDERVKKPGVAVGLVWTPVGGDIVFIEASRMRGGKQFTMTGHLGEVMQESMTAALTWTVQRRTLRHRSGLLPQAGHSHSRTVRRGPERRAIRRRRDGHLARQLADESSCEKPPGDDR